MANSSRNSILAVIVLILPIILINCGAGGKLTTERAQRAIDKWQKGVVVTGVQERPTENEAIADISFTNFKFTYNDSWVGRRTRVYSGPGQAFFKHYSDGRWVLVGISTAESDSVSWNLNIPVE